ncbi:unnamed protein product [Scytosiphon promiscuus]
MARRTRKGGFVGAVPFTFLALPAAGGTLAFGVPTVSAPSCALHPEYVATSPALESGARGRFHSVNPLASSRGGPPHGECRGCSASQVQICREKRTAICASRGATAHRRMLGQRSSAMKLGQSIDSLERGLQQQQQLQQLREENDVTSGVSAECHLRRGLRKLGNLRQPQNALELLAVARERGDALSLRVFNAAITAVAPCDEGCRYALRLLILMQEEQIAPDRFTLTAIVASCFRGQKWDVAYGVLKKMESQGMTPLDMRTSRLTSAPGEKSEARDEALRLLQRLRSKVTRSEDATSPSPRAGSERHRGRERASPSSVDGTGGAPAAATPVAGGEKDLRGGLPVERTSPELDATLSELKGAANTRSWERALELLDGLHEAGYDPHPGAYACAIRACGKAGKWEHSLALMDEMRSRGVEPGEGCNVMALKACADAGLWEKTLEMLKGMRASGVNRSESTFAVAMKACGDAGRWEEALALMDDMRRDGTPPMETTYTTAMKACGTAGKWERALKLFREMQDMDIPPTEQCFTAAIRALCGSGLTNEASSLLLQMRADSGIRTNMSVYRAVMDAYCRAGDWASALRLLEDARKDRLKPTTGDLRTMVEACGKADQHERALSLLEEMRSEGMNLRRTGEKLWWVFNTCRDKQIKDRAWALMEVEETRERVRLRAERNSLKTRASAATEQAASRRTAATSGV